MTDQILVSTGAAILLAIIAYFTGRKKNVAEAGDLISQSAVRLVNSMEARVAALEKQVADLTNANETKDKIVLELKERVENLTHLVEQKDKRVLALEQEVAWLFDQLPPETQDQYRQRFKRSH
jgi:predicted RNase H-like nuclease (RuvC/YqgF family)